MRLSRLFRRKARGLLNRIRPFGLREPVAAIFLYHTVEEEPSPWTRGHRYVTARRAFRQQIDFIARHFEVVTTRDLVGHLRDGRLDRNLASIHFDDGFRSYLDIALPHLREVGLPSALFLIRDVLEGAIPIRNRLAYILHAEPDPRQMLEQLQPYFRNDPDIDGVEGMSAGQFLSWSKTRLTPEREEAIDALYRSIIGTRAPISPFIDASEARQLATDPLVELGSHTRSHPMLSGMTAKDQAAEVLGGHEDLEKLVGMPLDLFAYPYGGRDHFDEISRSVVAETDRLIAFSTIPDYNRTYDRTDVRRITLSNEGRLRLKASLLDIDRSGYKGGQSRP